MSTTPKSKTARTPAVIYARYSTDNQDARSVEDQERRCRRWADEHGHEIIRVYSDQGRSGGNTNRPGLQALLAVARERSAPFRAVILDDLSRLSRDFGDTWNLLFKEFESSEIVVVDVTTGMASDNPAARITFGSLGLVNDMQRQSARTNTRRGLEGRALAGFHTGGRIFGYLTVPEPNPPDLKHIRKVLKVNPTEAAIVLRIFREYDQGASPRQIAADLNRAGIAAPYDKGGYTKPAGHGWSYGTVRGVLRNERYIGRTIYNRTRTRKGKAAKLNPEKDHIKADRPDLVIVKDRALWDSVQAKLRAARPLGAPKPLAKSRKSVFSGMGRCGVCGARLQVAGLGKGKYKSLKCAAHSSKGSEICPNGTSVTEGKLAAALTGAFSQMLEDPSYLDRFCATVERLLKTETKTRAATVATAPLDAELRKEQAKADRLLALVEADESGAPPAVLLDRLRAAQQRLDGLRAQRAALGPARPRAALPLPAQDRLRAAFREVAAILAGAPERGNVALGARLEPVVWTVRETAEGRVHRFATALKMEPAALGGRFATSMVAGAGFEPATFGL